MFRRNALVVALLTMTLIALEIAWTRVLSAEFFYTFAFLILSLAVLGLGIGALALRLWPRFAEERALPSLLLLSGITALIGPPLVFALGLDFSQLFRSWGMLGRLAATLLLLGAPHFFGGMAIAQIFKRRHPELPRLYMADLIGAAGGVLLLVPVMNQLGTPAATFLAVIPIFVAALITCAGRRRIVPLLSIALTILLATQAVDLLEVQREERAPVIYKHWDAVSKLKVLEYDEDFRGINFDNVSYSTVYGFDGNWDRPDSLRFEFGIDVSYLIDQFEDCTFLSLGAGGGTDVLQALQAGATEVHAVEVIPHVNHMMTRGFLADFTGRIYNDPRVIVATEDARIYVRQHPDTFDLIYSLSSNTFAALASGAFAMAENYLFTTEAFKDYWRALTADGFMMMEHQFYMPRLVAEAMAALTELGVTDPCGHFAVYNLPAMRRNILLLSKRPLTEEIRQHAFGELGPEVEEHIYLLYPPAAAHAGNTIEQIVEEGWQAAADSANANIAPTTDNRPFIAQLGLWRNLTWENLQQAGPYQEFMGFPASKVMILIILAVVLVLVVPLNLLPYLRRGPRLRAVPWTYFFLLGMAFMMIEVILIQQYTLLIGPSVYGLISILLALLLFSGIGSRFSERIGARLAFPAIVLWLLLDALCFPALAAALSAWSLVPRMLAAGLMIAPLGFFMGIPFPKGGLRVGEAIDWGYAVNGAATVCGATLVILVAFVFGYAVALLLAGALYLAAFGLFRWRAAW
jgi:predicted membrane-bound spermidine synthase